MSLQIWIETKLIYLASTGYEVAVIVSVIVEVIMGVDAV